MTRFSTRCGLAGLALVGSLVMAVSVACSAGPHPGPPVTPERQAVAEGAERALSAASARFTGTLLFSEPPEVAVTGFIVGLFRMAFHQAYPARQAAMLAQAADLRVVGTEQRNGVTTTHYAGTVEVGKLVADPRFGLTDQVIAELRQQFEGIPSEQLDLWLDERGFPVRVESRTNPEEMKDLELAVSADYRDYGAPVRIDPPPENEVIDAREADKLPPR